MSNTEVIHLSSGLDLLRKLAAITDGATDEVLGDAFHNLVRCNCAECRIFMTLLQRLRELREKRKLPLSDHEPTLGELQAKENAWRKQNP